MDPEERRKEDNRIILWWSLPPETRKSVYRIRNVLKYRKNPEDRQQLQEFEFLLDPIPRFVSYEASKRWVEENVIRTIDEYKKRIPPYMPKIPERYQGWKGWRVEFLMSRFVTYEEAKEWVRKNGIHTSAAYQNSNRPDSIPYFPAGAYKDKGWVHWGEFLGTYSCMYGATKKKFRLFTEARTFVRALNLKNLREFQSWGSSAKRPIDIPSCPHKVYREEGWTNWGDFLGTNNKSMHGLVFLPFSEAKTFVRALNLRNLREFQVWGREGNRPPNIPCTPNAVYRGNGWISWGDFLGTDNVSTSKKRKERDESTTT